MSLKPAADGGPAAWVVDGIRTFGVDVGSIVPGGYASYARLFHPAYRAGDAEVTWAEIAAANQRIVHPEMQWANISGVELHSGGSRPGLWDREPEVGCLPRTWAQPLGSLLERHTSTPEQAWFCIWDGWAGLHHRPTVRRRPGGRSNSSPSPPPTISLPNRDYYLLRGPVSSIVESFGDRWMSANLWWPDDRAWFVATEIDFAWTYVGGSEACIADVLGRFESLSVGLRDGITADADQRNPRP